MRRPQRGDLLSPLAFGVVVLAAAAPWLLGFEASHAAVANAIAFAMAFAPLALMVGALVPASVVCAAGGVWLAAAPWALRYATIGSLAWEGDLLLGTALASLSIMALRTPHYTAS